MLKDKNQNDIDLKNYRDPSGISVREMNIGLWFSENRRKITRFFTVFLILISAFFFIYSSYGYIIYFMSGTLDNQLENQVMSPRNVTSEMVIAAVEKFKNEDKTDLAVRLNNPNDNFSAEFEYCFKQGDVDLSCARSFILPSEDTHILAMAVSSDIAITAPTFVVKDIFWSRVNLHEIPDWAAYQSERINFEITNINFLGANKSGLSENLKLNSLSFVATNNSAFSYYEVPFDILLYSGSRLVGVERHTAQNFMSSEERAIKISWAGDLGTVSRIEITPRINLNNSDVYLKYQGLNK